MELYKQHLTIIIKSLIASFCLPFGGRLLFLAHSASIQVSEGTSLIYCSTAVRVIVFATNTAIYNNISFISKVISQLSIGGIFSQ